MNIKEQQEQIQKQDLKIKQRSFEQFDSMVGCQKVMKINNEKTRQLVTIQKRI